MYVCIYHALINFMFGTVQGFCFLFAFRLNEILFTKTHVDKIMNSTNSDKVRRLAPRHIPICPPITPTMKKNCVHYTI